MYYLYLLAAAIFIPLVYVMVMAIKASRMWDELTHEKAVEIHSMMWATKGEDAGKNMTQVMGLDDPTRFEELRRQAIMQQKTAAIKRAVRLAGLIIVIGVVYGLFS